MRDTQQDAAAIRAQAGRVERSATGVRAGMTTLGLLIGGGFALIFLPYGSNGLLFSIVALLMGVGGGFLIGDAQCEAMRLAARLALHQLDEASAHQSVVRGTDQR